MTVEAKAGWYQNGPDHTQQRFWDGQHWTEHVRPVPNNDTSHDTPPRPATGALLPPAGWFQNGSDHTQQRFWDGHSWTDQLRPTPNAAGMDSAVAVPAGVLAAQMAQHPAASVPVPSKEALFPAVPAAQSGAGPSSKATAAAVSVVAVLVIAAIGAAGVLLKDLAGAKSPVSAPAVTTDSSNTGQPTTPEGDDSAPGPMPTGTVPYSMLQPAITKDKLPLNGTTTLGPLELTYITPQVFAGSSAQRVLYVLVKNTSAKPVVESSIDISVVSYSNGETSSGTVNVTNLAAGEARGYSTSIWPIFGEDSTVELLMAYTDGGFGVMPKGAFNTSGLTLGVDQVNPSGMPALVGTLSSSFKQQANNVTFDILYFDPSGKLVGGDSASAGPVPAQGQLQINEVFYGARNPSWTYKIFANASHFDFAVPN